MVSPGYLSNSFNCYLWFEPTHFISVYCGLWFVPAQTLSLSFHRKKIVICDLCQHISFPFFVICDLCQRGQHFLSLPFHRKKLLFVIYANTFHFCLLWFVIYASTDNIFLSLSFHRKKMLFVICANTFLGLTGLVVVGCCCCLCLTIEKNCILFILNIVMSYTKEFHLQLCICLFSNEPNTNKISVVFLANRLLAIRFQWFWKEFLACLFSLQEIGMVNLDGICSCCLGLQVGYINESGRKSGLSKSRAIFFQNQKPKIYQWTCI